jgi:hypothetical protein
VPKSLGSDEISYLFGVGLALLSNPRNGMPSDSKTFGYNDVSHKNVALTLHKNIEEGLDSGVVVFVPMQPNENEEIR